jgi:DNA replication protein DnaC
MDELRGDKVDKFDFKEYLSSLRINVTDDTYVCDICQDTGIELFKDSSGSERGRECICEVKKRQKGYFAELMKTAMMSSVEDKTFESFIPTNKHQSDVLEIIRKKHRGYYLHGKYGIGKSHLITATAIKAINHNVPSVLFSVPMLLSEIRRSQFEDVEIEKRCQFIPYLILDDLGKEKSTEWVQERLFLLIDERYKRFEQKKGHTSFTSQFSIKDLNQRLDGAICSRISGMCQEIYINGDDYRERNRP